MAPADNASGASGKEPLFVAYSGPSMNPTLTEPEMVEVVPFGARPVRAGDVILFHSPGEGRSIVHRVISASPSGVRTRGDNNPRTDPHLLQPGDIAGRVVAAWRGQKRRAIAGGRAGRWVGRWMRARRALERPVSRAFRAPYYALWRSGVFQRLLPRRLRPRVALFRAGERAQRTLLMGQRVIGRYDNARGQWHIRRPFRLFVDERLLSQRENGEQNGQSQ